MTIFFHFQLMMIFSNQTLLHFRTIEEGRFLKCNSVFTEAAHVLVCDTFERIAVSIYVCCRGSVLYTTTTTVVGFAIDDDRVAQLVV